MRGSELHGVEVGAALIAVIQVQRGGARRPQPSRPAAMSLYEKEVAVTVASCNEDGAKRSVPVAVQLGEARDGEEGVVVTTAPLMRRRWR